MPTMPTMQEVYDTFVFLMNTPMVPPPVPQRNREDVALTEMPARTQERESRRTVRSFFLKIYCINIDCVWCIAVK